MGGGAPGRGSEQGRGGTRQRSVIIVGAGMAGVAAAQRLCSCQPDIQVTVLEARDRVGGRVFTREEEVPGLGTVRAEMGAQWVHRAKGNPITTLAQRQGIPLVQSREEYVHFSCTGRRYSEKELEQAEAAYARLAKKVLQYGEDQERDLSLESAFLCIDQRQFLSPFVQSRVAVDYEIDYGGLGDLSAFYYDDEEFRGDDKLFPGGFSAVPRALMAEVQKAGARLVLGFAVGSVERARTGVRVAGSVLATGEPVVHEADAVLVTVPLGVLKAGSIQFRPPLSPRKQGAIARLGFGCVNKVALFYGGRFWEPSTRGADEFGVEEERVPAGRGCFPFWRTLVRAEGQNALLGFASGEYARARTGHQERLVQDAQAKVRTMFPEAALPHNQPLAAWAHDWGADPFSLGSYSYARVGVHGNEEYTSDYDALGEPEGNVFFAGEHTNCDYRSTVHGAYLSGLREASRILQHI